MDVTQWVQHMSGQGEKWEIRGDQTDRHGWWVARDLSAEIVRLPKSEYVPCSPPERWEDVTEECEPQANGEIWHMHNHRRSGIYVGQANGYRLCKVQFPSNENVNFKKWAFIVERKVSHG